MRGLFARFVKRSNRDIGIEPSMGREMTTQIEQLREAIFAYNSKHNREVMPCFTPLIEAAQTLLEQHGPGIQGLLDGTHWIAPNEPTTEMWDHAESVSMFAEAALQDHALQKEQQDDLNGFPTVRIWHLVLCFRAMRDASLRNSSNTESL